VGIIECSTDIKRPVIKIGKILKLLMNELFKQTISPWQATSSRCLKRSLKAVNFYKHHVRS
jgi:hypothetical protein